MTATPELIALKQLHDAVVRHGLIEGDGPDWLLAFQDMMTALRNAAAVIDKAETAPPRAGRGE